ncbi:MAG TPA: DapH/DapD/GlmU-related protein, partial [Thermomicrobiaceae bacterium]|nr:DapH/DapD/GlmU-related protein [Thermomicrobiaceae bacterium]
VRRRINQRLMRSGVTIVDPATTFIDADVAIGIDTRVEPFTTISGATVIGEHCQIGPQSIIEDTQIGDGCHILASTVERAVLGNHVDIGPYSHLRPGAWLDDDVHVGNYVEIKNSTLRSGTKAGHVSYIGDASVGENVNIGAGTITANYDGVNKHRTTIGDRAFIGTNSSLRAPVTIGDGAVVGAGSVVTHDVAPGTTVAGVPARPMVGHERGPDAPGGKRTSSADKRSES